VKAACNELEVLPRDLAKMKALTVLDVSDNVIESLPETVCNLRSLTELNIADNRIMQFPQVCAEYCRLQCQCTLLSSAFYECLRGRQRIWKSANLSVSLFARFSAQ